MQDEQIATTRYRKTPEEMRAELTKYLADTAANVEALGYELADCGTTISITQGKVDAMGGLELVAPLIPGWVTLNVVASIEELDALCQAYIEMHEASIH